MKNYADIMKRTLEFSNNQINESFELIKKSINNTLNVVENSLNKKFKDSFNISFDEIYKILTDSMIENLCILSRYGWGYYYVEEVDDDYLSSMSMPKNLKKYIDNNQDLPIIEIDKFIGKYFTKAKLFEINLSTKKWLDDNDILKLDIAIKHYNARRYYECASMLVGLIDSQNIKQELYDSKNNVYTVKSTVDKNGNPNIDQGFIAFSIIFRNNFAKYFNNNEEFYGRKKPKTKTQICEEYINETKYKMDSVGYEIICAMFLLAILFADNNWSDKKPDIINRNWLMHGMYNYNDITKYDCMKLFLILYQLSHLYFKLKNNTLENNIND